MIQGKYLSNRDDLSRVIQIRKDVFGNELTTDTKDELSINVLVNDKQTEVGTGRITLDDGRFTMDMICVLKEYRGKGYGEFIVRLLADRALISGAKAVYLLATPNTVLFFEKLFFTKATLSDVENESDIKMVLDLTKSKTPCGHNCSK